MNPFEFAGTFWLPELATRRIHGEVKAAGEEFVVALDEPLHPASPAASPPSSDRIKYPTLYADLRGLGPVTFLAVVSSHWDPGTKWRSSLALVGDHVYEPVFTSCSLQFDVLAAWADPPSLVEWGTNGREIGDLSLKRTVLESADVEGMHIEIVSTWSGKAGHLKVDMTRETWLTVDHPPKDFDAVITDVLRPIQDLLHMLVGRTVGTTKWTVTPQAGGKPRSVRFRELVPNQYLDYESLWLTSYRSESVFRRTDLPIPFDRMLEGWFRTRSELHTAIALLSSSYRAPFMYIDNWFASTFQATEAITRKLLQSDKAAAKLHRERSDRIVTALRATSLDASDISWATERVRSGAQLSMAKQVQFFLDNTGPLGQRVTARRPTFAADVNKLRTQVSHPSRMSDETYQQLVESELILRWLVRTHLLVLSGLPTDDVVAQADARSQLDSALDQLDALD